MTVITNPITKELIISILSEKDSKDGLHVSMLTDKLLLSGNLTETDIDKVKQKVNSICLRESKKSSSEITKVTNTKTKRPKLGCYKLKAKRAQVLPKEPSVTHKDAEIVVEATRTDAQNLFTGKAGECAVMSELLFRGYNVNSMLVDDGVDIVASKNNMFYLVQVKTSTIKSNDSVFFTIKPERFETFMGYNIRYIIVARGVMNGIDTNLYFVFDNKDIQLFISKNVVSQTSTGINIKIRIDRTKGVPVLYHDGKEMDVDFYMNSFKL